MRRTSKQLPTSDVPEGWDEERVRAVIDYYDAHQDELLALATEAASNTHGTRLMEVPTALVPTIRALIARYEAAVPEESSPTPGGETGGN